MIESGLAVKFTLESNRKATAADVTRCREIVAAIRSATLPSYDEVRWTDPFGQTVHGVNWIPGFDKLDNDYLDNLRCKSGMFSGWTLRDMLLDDPVQHWVDDYAKYFGPEDQREWPIAALQHYTKGLPPEYRCSPPLIAGEIGYDYKGICANPDTVRDQERMVALYRSGLLEAIRGRKAPIILEIGAGIGILAYYIKNVVPHAQYYIVDIPTSLMFAGCYLTLAGRSLSVLPGEAVDAIDYRLVPASSLQLVEIGPIDLAINTWSFQEMPHDVVSGYAKFLAKHFSPEGALFEQNLDLRKNYPDRPNYCNPRPALTEHLELEKTLEGRYLWNAPNIWRRPGVERRA